MLCGGSSTACCKDGLGRVVAAAIGHVRLVSNNCSVEVAAAAGCVVAAGREPTLGPGKGQASGQDRAAESSTLALVLGATDPIELLSFCLPTSWVRLQAACRAFTDSTGHLPAAMLKRLSLAYLGNTNIGVQTLHGATENGCLDAVWSHLRLGVDPNCHDVYGFVPLHFAAAKNNIGVYKLLIAAKADVHAPHTDDNVRMGWTPLHFAAHAGARDVLTLLLLQGARVNEMDNCRRTALFYAQRHKRAHCIRLLTKFGGVGDLHYVEPSRLQLDAFADGTADRGGWESSHGNADRVNPAPPYIGPAGDTGQNLTQAALVMPGFEW